jgi:C1A family cysteine protease
MPYVYIPNLNPFRSKVYGYLRDPQLFALETGPTDWLDRDKGIQELLAVAPEQTTGDVDLRRFCTDSNQGSLSSCVGNATADAVEIVSAIAGKGGIELSRLFVYAMARILNGNLNKDGGTYIRSAFESLTKFGICKEDLWPYEPNKVFTSPSLKAQQLARSNKIHSYYRIKSVGPQRVKDAVAALRAHKPVVFGTQLDNSFFGIRSMNPIGVPKGPFVGGHAMVLVGYKNGNFIAKNSWGTSWGDGGYWSMTPDYFAWPNTWDIWVPTLGIEFQ